MRRYLYALIASLMAAWSCNVDGGYYAENMSDIVTVRKQQLVNDNGAVFKITQTDSGVQTNWEEGKRYLLYFDVLNKELEIRLHSITPVTVMAASPYDEEEPVPHDPIGIVSHWIGGGYLNLAINYYKGKDSQFEHTFLLRSSLDEATSVLHLYLFHDGNGENPPQKETSDLVVESGIFSLSLGDEPLSGLVFTYDSILLQDGEYTILPQSVSSY